MTDQIIPEDIRQFILENIDSIAQWECLLLLRANPEARWNAEEVARNLYVDEPSAATVLGELVSKGFLKTSRHGADIIYHYGVSEETEQRIDQASVIYARYLVPMTNLIHSKTKNRIQEFADAFRLRKD